MEKVKNFGSSVAKAVRATFKNEGGYTAIKITKLSSGTFELDHDALRDLLFQPKVGDRPIALISIAGCLRTGKSFLLNFLLRYLRNEGWNNAEWMGTSDTVLDDGINWRGGQEPNTTGILVWNEVFIMKKRNGDELAVLLMDTQGLFDNNTTKENNIRLLMTSAIASSVQLLNIKNLIQERDLENLHTCVEFAMTAAKTEQNQFQLQTLLFIIRDWDNVEENEFGLEGGNMYLESVLRSREGGKELNEVRQYLRKTFSKLECFLMPEPGKEVRRSGHGMLENKQIDEEFMEFVEKFTDHLLHPDNIVVKQSQGKPLTARQLLTLLATTDNTFGSGKIVVEDLLEGSIKAHYSAARDQSVDVYGEQMKKKHKANVVTTDENLKAYHEEALKKAFEQFNSTSEIGPPEKKDEYREQLKEECEKLFKTTRDLNENLRLTKIKKEQEEREKAYEEYKSKMDETKTSSSVAESEIQTNHDTILNSIQSKLGTKVNADKLTSMASEYLKERFEKNKEMKKHEDARREDKEGMEQLKAVEDFIIRYERKLEKGINKLLDDSSFEALHESKKASLKGKFTEKFAKYASHAMYSEQLETKFNDRYKNMKEKNIKKRESAKETIRLQVDSYILEYRQKVQETMTDKYIAPEALKKSHDDAKDMVRRGWSYKFGSYPPDLTASEMNRCMERVDAEFKKLSDENEKNKPNKPVQSSKTPEPEGGGGWCTIL